MSVNTGKIVFYEVDAQRNKIEGKKEQFKVEGIEPEKSNPEFFRALSRYLHKKHSKGKDKEKLAKDQREKPSVEDNDQNDDDKKNDEDEHEEKTRWTSKEFEGYDLQWVRAKIPDLPKRMDTVPNC